jgi:hypothetical protein
MTKTRKLPAKKKITEPGVYDISIDRYHTQCTDGPSLSSTGIRRILQSPAHYWKFSELNPAAAEQPEKSAFILGRAAHHLLLGEKDFLKNFSIEPETYSDVKTGESKKWNNNATICREWKAAQIEEGKTVLSGQQLETIRGMAGLLPWQKGMTNCGLKNTPLVMSGALSGEIERSLFWKQGGVWLKARPDAIPGDSNDFADLKTISSKSMLGLNDFDLQRAIRDHRYYVQAAMVGMGAAAVLGRPMTGFHLIFVDTGDVHAVSPITIDEGDIVRGERAIYLAVELFERCLKTKLWPGPTARQADARKMSINSTDAQAFDAYLDTIEQELA